MRNLALHFLSLALSLSLSVSLTLYITTHAEIRRAGHRIYTNVDSQKSLHYDGHKYVTNGGDLARSKLARDALAGVGVRDGCGSWRGL